MRSGLLLVVAVAILDPRAPFARAEDSAPPPDSPQAKQAKEEEEKPKESGVVEDVVVSASARAEALLDAPAAVSVISGKELLTAPGDQLVDHLRRVPGINVVQFS